MANALGQDSITELRIHRYTAFHSQQLDSSNGQSGDRARQQIQLSVHGTTLLLNLEDNIHLSAALTNNKRIELLRGTLENKPLSWVRLTRTATGTHGLIWDGVELHVVAPSNEVRSALAISLPAPNSDSIIFKLSDTTADLGAEYCGSMRKTDTAPNTGLATYQALTSSLSGQVTASGGEPTLRLEIQVLGDAAFRAQYSSDQAALDAIMVRLNNVDGIFTAQMGLEVQATDVQIYSSDPATLSSSTNADTLLSSVGQLRHDTPGMSSYAATHLFTGRDLDGNTLGAGYIGNICNARYGASLSELRDRGAWIDSLVAAHELGHQLGAVHDGTGVCASTPAQTNLMSAQINGSSDLSQCSRDSIFAIMQQAACLVPIGAPDVSVIKGGAPLQALTNATLQWSVPVKNVGTGRADAPTVHLALPVNVIVEDAAIAGGSCISGNNSAGGMVDCQFDTLAANETRLLQIGLHGQQAGFYEISASVGVSNDLNPVNNSAIFNLIVSDAASGTASTGLATSGKHGGGGAFSLGWLLLGSLAGLRRQSFTPMSGQNTS
ncbi:MAG: M12 family metallo-peptidase [Steroidobacteraceae bacterium]